MIFQGKEVLVVRESRVAELERLRHEEALLRAEENRTPFKQARGLLRRVVNDLEGCSLTNEEITELNTTLDNIKFMIKCMGTYGR